jgi:hypothetical protein
VCSTLGCVTFSAHTSLFSRHVKDRATTAGLAPCERVFHAQVCALQITHISVLAARQRQCHDGRACPLRACVPRSGVCASNHTHLCSRSTSKTVSRRQGLPPASVCSTLRCVRFKSHTSLFSQHVKDSATTAGLAPCERVFHTRGCELQRTHLSVLAARQRSRHDGRACPLRAWVPRSGVSTSAPSHLDSPSASEDRTTTAGLAPASVCSTLRCVHVSTCSPCIS